MQQSSTPAAPSRSSSQPALETARVGLVGGRGHTGAELLRLIAGHPRLALSFASSREMAGKPVRDVTSRIETDLTFIDSSPHTVSDHDVDVLVLALPNGVSNEYIDAINRTRSDLIIVDLSADHRFDDTWVYGLPELSGSKLAGTTRIANPGCYATAIMLALAPIVDQLDGTPHVFGVSGYSGAGTTPSSRNDPDALRDNLLPYQLADHLHEREVSHQLGHAVRFAPHVAPFFRGITVTVMATLKHTKSVADLAERYRTFYKPFPLIEVIENDTPLVRDAANRITASIGGFTVSSSDGHNISVVATLDNLLKGAASQAIQNINLACGFQPLEGLTP